MSITAAIEVATTRPVTQKLLGLSELGGRAFLSAIFLVSGFGKITGYSATAGYMDSMGVPGFMLPLVIATELLGGAAILLGWQTRVAAFLLAGFTLLSALLFHNDFADQGQIIHFLKNVAIAGAFLMLVANGAGTYSLDKRGAK